MVGVAIVAALPEESTSHQGGPLGCSGSRFAESNASANAGAVRKCAVAANAALNVFGRI